MTEFRVPVNDETAHDALSPAPDRPRAQSPRGPFAVFHAPPIERPPTPLEVADEDISAVVDTFDYQGLLAKHDEPEARAAVTEMIRALMPGSTVTWLFTQRGPDGMSLAHAWFGPNLPLYSHSHPRHGDCLYYVLAGQIVLGSRVLNAGDGFFVPNARPYKYCAGPEGVEVLEFRTGGGIKGAPHTQLYEPSLQALEQITETARRNHPVWTAPSQVASRPLRSP